MKLTSLTLCAVAPLTLIAASDTPAPDLQATVAELQATVQKLEARVTELERQTETDPSEAKPTEALSIGQQKFEAICMACHKYQRGQPMLGPPVFAVQDHYNRGYEDDAEWIQAVVDYVKKPTEEASLMPGARIKFGIMPALPLPDEDLKQIADFLRHADLQKPGWYDQHYKEEHGSGGPQKMRRGQPSTATE